jgi:hypothetical protein
LGTSPIHFDFAASRHPISGVEISFGTYQTLDSLNFIYLFSEAYEFLAAMRQKIIDIHAAARYLLQ